MAISSADYRRILAGRQPAKPSRAPYGSRKRAASERGKPAIELTLPLPPSANRYWRYGRGRVYPSPEAEQYKQTVARLGLAAQVRPFRGPCRLTVLRFWFASRRRDIDSGIKVLLDALQGVAYVNDRQIEAVPGWEREIDRDNPRVVVRVEAA